MEYPSTFNIIERNWEGWHFQSSNCTNLDKMVCYTRLKDNEVFKEVIEVYSGDNYVTKSKKRSH